MSAILQAKAFSDAAELNQQKADQIRNRLLAFRPTKQAIISLGSMDRTLKSASDLRKQMDAHTQFAEQCRAEARRLQQHSPGRAA